MAIRATVPSGGFVVARGTDWYPLPGSGLRELGSAVLWACALLVPMLGIGGWITYHSWRAREDQREAAILAARAHDRLVAADPLPVLPIPETTRGRDLFVGTCVACHGPTGTGIEGLGKNLTTSPFVAAQSDESLREFIITGRPNAKPMPMPPRAGREDLTDDDLRHIVMYVRGLQDPRRMPELPAMVVVNTPPTEAEKAQALAAAGGDAELAGYIANGNKLFHTICIACHAKGGVGIPGSGKPLVANQFIQSLNDDGLLAFVKKGRDPSDPKNTTGVGMPPKGGNPALSDDDLLDIIAYVRTLQGTKPALTQGQK